MMGHLPSLDGFFLAFPTKFNKLIIACRVMFLMLLSIVFFLPTFEYAELLPVALVIATSGFAAVLLQAHGKLTVGFVLVSSSVIVFCGAILMKPGRRILE